MEVYFIINRKTYIVIQISMTETNTINYAERKTGAK